MPLTIRNDRTAALPKDDKTARPVIRLTGKSPSSSATIPPIGRRQEIALNELLLLRR
jgi:hypothetical protein